MNEEIKYITIDCEGDGLNAKYNRQVFPDGNHFDPDTRIWCITIAGKNKNNEIVPLIYVCKLPNTCRRLPRPYIDKYGNTQWNTSARHEPSTVVPSKVGKYNVHSYESYEEFLKAVSNAINKFANAGYYICFKGYFSHDYDKELLAINFAKYNISANLNTFTNISVKTNEWKATTAQVQAGGWKSNQEYLNDGIQHNVEDALQLYKFIDKKYISKK